MVSCSFHILNLDLPLFILLTCMPYISQLVYTLFTSVCDLLLLSLDVSVAFFIFVFLLSLLYLCVSAVMTCTFMKGNKLSQLPCIDTVIVDTCITSEQGRETVKCMGMIPYGPWPFASCEALLITHSCKCNISSLSLVIIGQQTSSYCSQYFPLSVHCIGWMLLCVQSCACHGHNISFWSSLAIHCHLFQVCINRAQFLITTVT